MSPEGRIVKVNKTLANWMAKDESEILGKSFRDLLNFGGKIAFETHLAPLLRLQESVYEIALDLIDNEGERIPVIANAAERRDEQGNHRFTRLTLFKAVDRRTFERSLIEAKTKAEAESEQQKQDARLREQFIAVLGHDLRNPLAAIDAGIHVLRRRISGDGKAGSILDEMCGSVARAHRLISDVMDFARGRLGAGLALSLEAGCDLEPLFKQVVEEVRAIHPDREIDVAIAVPDPVTCDQPRLGQLASNLLSNAVTHGASDQPVTFEAKTSKEELVVKVSNGGPAIPPQTAARLFTPFVRGTAENDRAGLGLGLFIVKEIADAHGGTVSVTSDDELTSFTLTMPRSRGSRSLSA
ncbi:PAS domain-containing sensor histidine kinase [Sphingomicrobium sp. B8]|uniref:histidine kinase n=1 Tax=Sphingomicrobium clamense TaxID=2851013 RepID=A0ABS6V793_9SPHN|nr:PAS domain-containing sensor histidine kinase [Sphingomicrobium sp. B8]